MLNSAHLKSVFRHLAYAGLSEDADIEILRKVFLINVFSTIGMAFLLGFGVNALLNHHSSVALVTLTLAGLTTINYVMMLRYGNHNRGAHAISLIMAVLFFYLLCSGGVNLTGPLWCYSAAPFLLFIYGVRWGAICVGFLFVAALVLLYHHNPFLVADYPETFKSRFLASFLAVAIMSYLHEYARYRSYGAFQVLRQKVEREARTDELTGLSNRRHMYEYMQYTLQRLRRRRLPLSVLLIDVDNFKLINDNYGHQFGDRVLIRIAHSLKQCLRNHDAIARWGGEEFLVLLAESDNAAAKTVAEKLRSTIEAMPIEFKDNMLSMTISIGIHTANPEVSLDTLLSRADENLYAAKNSGRNRIIDSSQESLTSSASRS
jgi:diguanylate cyclase (GGDEF)-like protein